MTSAVASQHVVATRSRRVTRPQPRITYRAGQRSDAAALHALIAVNAAEGHLLPRTLDELEQHAGRFVVAVVRGRVVGCAELAPLAPNVAEVRSLVVDPAARSRGIGRALVSTLVERARTARLARVCAFTHDAGYFARMGFSIVPHVWLPEKIALDCQRCPLFRRCGQHAVLLTLAGDARGTGSDALRLR